MSSTALSTRKQKDAVRIEAFWKHNFLHNRANPQKVAEELYAIRDELSFNEAVTIVRKYAEDPKTELHKCLEWDNKIASEKYRILQVRSVLSGIAIRRVTADSSGEKKEFEIRLFESIPQKSRTDYRHYVLNHEALEEGGKLAEAIIQEISNWMMQAKHKAELYSNVIGEKKSRRMIHLLGKMETVLGSN